VLRSSSTEAPSLHRSYPASSVLRAPPPPHAAWPASRELPVDPNRDHRLGLPVLRLVSYAYMPSPIPRQVRWTPFARVSSIVIGLPCIQVRSAPALSFSRPAQRSLTLRPARSPSRHRDPLHRRLRQCCCLHCRSGCYRVERTSSRARFPLAEEQRLFTAHLKQALVFQLLVFARGEVLREREMSCSYCRASGRAKKSRKAAPAMFMRARP
jgi:hypothetical protein